MSLFIGKDNSNVACAIITKTETSLSSIKASVPNKSNNFAIDTRRNLLFYDIYSAAPSVVGSYASNNNINGNFNYNIYRISIPSTLIGSNGNIRAFMIYINNFSVRIELPLPLNSSRAGASVSAYYYGGTYLDIHSISSISSIQIISTYQTINGSDVFPRDNSNGVLIGNNKFIVGGINYFNSKYLISGAINGVDPSINISGSSFQLINCYNSDALSFDLYSSSGIKIYTGSKLVLDSVANYLQAFIVNQSPTIIDFSIVGDYVDKDIYITTLPSSYQIIALTFYPRYSINPYASTTAIVLSNANPVGLSYSLFPFINGGGAVQNGIFFISFKIINKVVYLSTEYIYDGDPDDSVPDRLNMRMSYIVLAE